MERYLVYDAQCTACNRLAERIQEAVSGRMKGIDIRVDEARNLLDRAYPAGWKHNPYLVSVDHGEVRAWTGTGAALRLGLLMGPRKALRVWSLARRSGIALPPGSSAAIAYGASRRRFLKASAALATAGVLVGWHPAPKAFAGDCDCNCYADCYFTQDCSGCFGCIGPCYGPVYYVCYYSCCPPDQPVECDAESFFDGYQLCTCA